HRSGPGRPPSIADSSGRRLRAKRRTASLPCHGASAEDPLPRRAPAHGAIARNRPWPQRSRLRLWAPARKHRLNGPTSPFLLSPWATPGWAPHTVSLAKIEAPPPPVALLAEATACRRLDNDGLAGIEHGLV